MLPTSDGCSNGATGGGSAGGGGDLQAISKRVRGGLRMLREVSDLASHSQFMDLK